MQQINTTHFVKMIRKFILLLFTGLLLACNGNGQVQNNSQSKQEVKRTFELPDVPTTLKKVEERLDYVIAHYWDKFDFKDTAYIHLPEVTEQAIADYVDLLNRTTREKASTALKGVMEEAMVEQNMLKYINSQLRRYLIDRNSPFRNEELYEPVAQILLEKNVGGERMRTNAKRDLKLIALNRKGSIANNFSFILPDGGVKQLHQVDSPLTLLLFFDPDCYTCINTIHELKNCEALNQNNVKVVAIYPDGDADIWKDYLKILPKNWINGHDRELAIHNKELYNLNAMPTLYLLDAKKRVLIKDGSMEEIVQYLQEN